MATVSRDRLAAYGLTIVLISFGVGWLVSGRFREAPINPNIVGVVPGNIPAGFVAGDEAAERERVESEREARELEEQEQHEFRQRAATTALIIWHNPHVRNAIKILDSREVSFGRFAFMVRTGSLDYFIVEGGSATLISEEQYEWETMLPESLVSHWAERELADGGYRVKNMTRYADPPSFKATVVNRQTGTRWTIEFDGFRPSGTPKITTTQIDY